MCLLSLTSSLVVLKVPNVTFEKTPHPCLIPEITTLFKTVTDVAVSSEMDGLFSFSQTTSYDCTKGNVHQLMV